MAKRRDYRHNSTNDNDPLASRLLKIMSRDKELTRIYRPGNEKQNRIHTTGALTLVIGGANRSGKSVCGFTEAVSRITGEPLYDINDNPIPSRFWSCKPGDIARYWFVGYNLDHIGQTFYRMLFEPGMGGVFTVIYDPNMGRYVKWNENIPWHRENADRKELSEPLIPSRLIREDSWTWNPYGGGQAKKCWSSVELTNGAVLYAFPSTTPQPKQGDPIHGLLIDEDVATGGHVAEYFQRLADNEGWAIWPAWPHDENYVLSNLIDGCKLAMETNDKRSEYILLTMDENPFFTDKAVALAKDRMRMLGDDDLVESRVFGIMGHESRKMYDFNYKRHGISSANIMRAVPDLDPLTPRGALQAVYRKHGKFPDEWTRYASVDPSTTRTVVLFGVVPPPEVLGVQIPPCIIIENEAVLKRSTPKGVAMATKEIIGVRRYEAFVLDKNFGRQRHFAADGASTVEVLAAAFKEEGVTSRLTENWFVMGCNKTQDRYASVRELLSGEGERPSLFVLLDTTPETQKEFGRYYKAEIEHKGVKSVDDAPENPRKFDCMAALEYLAHYIQTAMQMKQHYVSPGVYGGDDSMATIARTIVKQDAEESYIHLGPGARA